MMDDYHWNELRSDDELEYGILMVVKWDELKGENWVMFSIIKSKLNINSTWSDNIHNTVDNDNIRAKNGE